MLKEIPVKSQLILNILIRKAGRLHKIYF